MATTIGSIDLASLKNLRDDLTQYFWFESSSSATYGAGAHVTLVPDTSFISNPTGQNILMNTDGFSIRNGLLPMMTLDNNSLDFNVVDTTAGTYVPTATFAATGAQIGQSKKTHVNVYSNSLELTDSAGTTFFKVRDAVNESGQVTDTFVGDGETTQFTLSYAASDTNYTVTQNGTVVSLTKTTTKITFSTAPAVGDIIVVVYNVVGNSAKAYDLGIRGTNTISGSYSVIEGYKTIASGEYSHAEGDSTTASETCSHAEGYRTTASGRFSHAEGSDTKATLFTSHAEGYRTTASGHYSHAEGSSSAAVNVRSHAEGNSRSSGDSSHSEGKGTLASGDSSHAEGSDTWASGDSSHAEGRETSSSGMYSHAQNLGTKAISDAQTVIGKYNKNLNPAVSNLYSFIIGNGNGTADDARSNALTVDWKGNVNLPTGKFSGIGETLTYNASNSGTNALEINNASSNALTVDWNGKIQTSQMQAGTIAATSVYANSYTDASVTFSSEMSDVPIVVCGVVSTSTAGAIGSITSAVTSTSKTGFTCRIFNAGSTTRTPSVNWIALNV